MRMRAQHMPQPGRNSRPVVLMLMAVLMLGAVPMLMLRVMAGRARVAHNAQDAPENLLQHLNHSTPHAPANQSLSEK